MGIGMFAGVPTLVIGLLLVMHLVDHKPSCGTRLESMLLAYVSFISLFIWLIYLKKIGQLEIIVSDVELLHTIIVQSMSIFAVLANISLISSLIVHWIRCNGGKQRWILVVDTVLTLALVCLTTAISYFVITEEICSYVKKSRSRYRAVDHASKIITSNTFDGLSSRAVLELTRHFHSKTPPCHPSINNLYILFVRSRLSIVLQDAAEMSMLFAEYRKYGSERREMCVICTGRLLPLHLVYIFPCCLEISHQSCFSRNADCPSCNNGSVMANLRNDIFLERMNSFERLNQAILFDLITKKYGRRNILDLNWAR